MHARVVLKRSGLALYDGVDESMARDSVLRGHLARELGCAASSLIIERDSRGKPHLLAPHRQLSFSIAHRANLLLVGTHLDGPIGVDIELVGESPWAMNV